VGKPAKTLWNPRDAMLPECRYAVLICGNDEAHPTTIPEAYEELAISKRLGSENTRSIARYSPDRNPPREARLLRPKASLRVSPSSEKQRKIRFEKGKAAMTINYKTESDRMKSSPEIHPHQVSEFTRHVGDLCARREIDIYQLAERLAMDPAELLEMVNGRLMPTDAVLSGLSKELDSDVRNLKMLAEKMQQDR